MGVGEEALARRGERELRRKEKGEEREGARTKISLFGRASGDTCRIDNFDKFGPNFGR